MLARQLVVLIGRPEVARQCRAWPGSGPGCRGLSLCSPKEKVTKEKGRPTRRRYLVAVSHCAARSARRSAQLAHRFYSRWHFGHEIPADLRASTSSHSARPKPRADLRCSGGSQGPRNPALRVTFRLRRAMKGRALNRVDLEPGVSRHQQIG